MLKDQGNKQSIAMRTPGRATPIRSTRPDSRQCVFTRHASKAETGSRHETGHSTASLSARGLHLSFSGFGFRSTKTIFAQRVALDLNSMLETRAAIGEGQGKVPSWRGIAPEEVACSKCGELQEPPQSPSPVVRSWRDHGGYVPGRSSHQSGCRRPPTLEQMMKPSCRVIPFVL
jgi:hypothetical protein